MTRTQALRYLIREGKAVTCETVRELTKPKRQAKRYSLHFPSSDERDRLLGRTISGIHEAIVGCRPTTNKPSDEDRILRPLPMMTKGDKPFRGDRPKRPDVYVSETTYGVECSPENTGFKTMKLGEVTEYPGKLVTETTKEHGFDYAIDERQGK